MTSLPFPPVVDTHESWWRTADAPLREYYRQFLRSMGVSESQLTHCWRSEVQGDGLALWLWHMAPHVHLISDCPDTQTWQTPAPGPTGPSTSLDHDICSVQVYV